MILYAYVYVCVFLCAYVLMCCVYACVLMFMCSECMCACVYSCVGAWVCMYVCMCILMCASCVCAYVMCAYVCMCLCACVYLSFCGYDYTSGGVYVYACVCLCTWIHMSLCMCVYVSLWACALHVYQHTYDRLNVSQGTLFPIAALFPLPFHPGSSCRPSPCSEGSWSCFLLPEPLSMPLTCCSSPRLEKDMSLGWEICVMNYTLCRMISSLPRRWKAGVCGTGGLRDPKVVEQTWCAQSDPVPLQEQSLRGSTLKT